MKRFIFIFTIVLPSLLFGQLDRSIRPTAAAAPTINIKDSEVFKLENGITVILSENHKIPRVSFNLVMGSSPRLERELTGLSEIAGSLIMSGTDNRSKDQLDSEIDYIGASLRADNNSLFLSCLTKHMDKGLTLMSDVLKNANFPQDEVDRIIKQNESSLLSVKSDPGSMARNAEAVANFPQGHPYGEIMTQETLDKINRDAIVNYYKQMFMPEGSYLVVVGDINRENAEKMARQYFGDWKGSGVYQQEWGTGKFNKGNRVLFVKKPGAVQSVIYVSFAVAIKPGHEDYLKLTVLNNILGGGGFGNRLMQNLREDKAFTYGARSRMTITRDGSWFSAGGNFRNEVTDSAITELLYEIKRITESKVKADELSLSKSSMAGGFSRSLERPSTVARFALSIIRNELPKDYYQTYLKRLEAITAEDLLEIAKKYMQPGKCNIVVVGNEEVVDRLMQFDSDGEIERVDAFGKEVKEMTPSDISADQLLEKYIGVITKGLSGKKLTKKLKKIKSMEEVTELQLPQMPFPLKATRAWIAPNVRCQRMEGNGMMFQSSYFDGEKGSTNSMQGGKKEMTSEEVAAAKKTVGFIPELNYASSGMKYEVLGIEKLDGKDCYVLKLDDGESETFDYFDKESFLKVARTVIEQNAEGESQEINTTFGEYGETDGILFPATYNVTVGEMNFSGKVVSRSFNAKIDESSFQ